MSKTFDEIMERYYANGAAVTFRRLKERDVLLTAALERILDAGEYVWSEADDAMVYSIHLPEASVEEFRALLGETTS